MTGAERSAWLALYAAAWFQPTGFPPGVTSEPLRAMHAARVASRGLQVLRDLSVEVAEGRLDLPDVAEVLG